MYDHCSDTSDCEGVHMGRAPANCAQLTLLKKIHLIYMDIWNSNSVGSHSPSLYFPIFMTCHEHIIVEGGTAHIVTDESV